MEINYRKRQKRVDALVALLSKRMRGNFFSHHGHPVQVVSDYKNYICGRCIYFRMNEDLTELADRNEPNGSNQTTDFRMHVVPVNKRTDGDLVTEILNIARQQAAEREKVTK